MLLVWVYLRQTFTQKTYKNIKYKTKKWDLNGHFYQLIKLVNSY